MSKTIASLLFLAAAFSLFWFWTKPFLEEVDTLVLKKEAIDKALADSRQLQGLRDSLLEQYNAVSGEDLSKISKILPRDSEISKLTVELENIARSNGVVLKTVKPERVEQAAQSTRGIVDQEKTMKPQRIDWDIVVSSAYGGFLGFLGEMQKSLRLIDVDNITFSAKESNFYEFTIKAKTYWIK